MDFGKPIQKVIDSILGGDSAPSADRDAPASSGSGFSVSKSLFGDDPEQPGAEEEPDDAVLPDPAEDIAMEPHAVLEGALETLVIWALDEQRQPMPRAPYRLRVGDDVRLGHADESGRIEEANLRPSELCVLSWGEPMDDSDGFTYVCELYWDIDDVTDADERRLYNLAYFGASTDERLALFQADHVSPLDDVHGSGSDSAVGGGGEAVATNDDDASDFDAEGDELT